MRVFSSKIKGRKNIKKLVIVVFFVVVVTLFWNGKFSFLNKITFSVFKPVLILKSESVDFFKNYANFVFSKKKLIEENSFLRNEINGQNLLLTKQKILEEENLLLKELLGRTKEQEETILASIILKPGFNFYNSLFLDVGSNLNIKRGNRVLVENVLVGEIDEVYKKSSKVKLFSFPKDKLNLVLGVNKIPVVATAKSDGVFEVRIPQGLHIKKGDVLTFPEEDLRILALVEKIIINSEDPFQTILCKSPVNFFELKWVQIIKD